MVVYVVDPETDSYREFSSTDNYTESLQQAKDGENFFEKVRKVAHEANYPADLKRFLSAFTKENVMAEIARSGIFTFGYRIMMDGRPVHVQMKAALVEEKEGARLIVGLNDVDAQIRQKEEIEKRLEQAQAQANIDALTGVKNKHAFLETETRIDRQISISLRLGGRIHALQERLSEEIALVRSRAYIDGLTGPTSSCTRTSANTISPTATEDDGKQTGKRGCCAWNTEEGKTPAGTVKSCGARKRSVFYDDFLYLVILFCARRFSSRRGNHQRISKIRTHLP